MNDQCAFAIGLLAVVLPGVCSAQTLPSVSSSGSQYVLTIPYLEYGTGSAKLAYGCAQAGASSPASGTTSEEYWQLQVIYADARSAGSSSTVDFEDWESTGASRNVVFVWPNGDPLNDTAEGYIDDYHFLAPTGNLDLQVMYMAITDGSIAPIGAAAILQNP